MALSSAVPVRMPSGAMLSVVVAPMVAIAVLGGPSAAVIAAAVGTLEWREVKGLFPNRNGVPWYGTLYNHAEAVIPAALAGILYHTLAGPSFEPSARSLVIVAGVGLIYFATNNALAALLSSVRDGETIARAFATNARQFGLTLAGLAPLAWLMAAMYVVAGPIGILPFAVPLYATRVRLQEGRRDPRHVHPDGPEPGRRGRRQGSVHRRPLRARPADRQGPWRGAAAAPRPSWRRSSGAACCTTSARSASPTRSCSSRAR